MTTGFLMQEAQAPPSTLTNGDAVPMAAPFPIVLPIKSGGLYIHAEKGAARCVSGGKITDKSRRGADFNMARAPAPVNEHRAKRRGIGVFDREFGKTVF